MRSRLFLVYCPGKSSLRQEIEKQQEGTKLVGGSPSLYIIYCPGNSSIRQQTKGEQEGSVLGWYTVYCILYTLQGIVLSAKGLKGSRKGLCWAGILYTVYCILSRE